MGISIRTNIAAESVSRTMNRSSSDASRAMERLSSGLRLNRAADDAAGLGIAARMRAQVSGLEQAERNAQDGISMMQTADGALDEITQILNRVRDLAVQYNNGTYSDTDKSSITAEVTQLNAELTRVLGSTTYNGINLLGSGSVDLQVGPNSGDTLTVNGADASTALGTAVSAFATDTTGTADIAAIQDAIDAISVSRSKLGATQNRIELTVTGLAQYRENLMAAKSRIEDADMAMEMARFTKAQIQQQVGAAMLAQANAAPNIALQLMR